jgi:hypothetical protein
VINRLDCGFLQLVVVVDEECTLLMRTMNSLIDLN